jgi:hypothetical protein
LVVGATRGSARRLADGDGRGVDGAGKSGRKEFHDREGRGRIFGNGVVVCLAAGEKKELNAEKQRAQRTERKEGKAGRLSVGMQAAILRVVGCIEGNRMVSAGSGGAGNCEEGEESR